MAPSASHRGSRRRVLSRSVATAIATALTAVAGIGTAAASDTRASSPGAVVVRKVADCPGKPTAAYNARADRYSLYNQVRAMGADTYYDAGYFGREPSGKPVDIAVIDSGVSAVAGFDNGNLYNGPDLSFESQAPFGNTANADLPHRDAFGHGTHLAGIIAGRDSVTPSGTPAFGPYSWKDPTKFTGVAPGARILNMKVADSQGAVDITQIIAAVDWVVQHRKDAGMNVRVLNLAYGVRSLDQPDQNALSYALDQAWKAGITVVVSAGNDGHWAGRYSSLPSPADDPHLLVVGAYDAVTGRPTDFTNGSLDRTADVLAPGSHVMSLHVPNAQEDAEIKADCLLTVGQGDRWTSPIFGADQRFVRGSGTSQASAMVSGVVALMLSKNPDLTPAQIKTVLRSTAAKLDDFSDVAAAGKVRLDGTGGAFDAVAPNVVDRWTPFRGGWLSDSRAGDALPCLSMTSAIENMGTWDTKAQAYTGGLCSWLVNKTGSLLQMMQEDVRGMPYDPIAHAKQEEIDPTTGRYVLTSASKRAWTTTAKGDVWNGAVWAGSSFGADPGGRMTWSVSRWGGADWQGQSFSAFNWSVSRWGGSRWSGGDLQSSRWSATSWVVSRWGGNSFRDNAWN